MRVNWRTLEREIVNVLKEHGLHTVREGGEVFFPVDFDLPMNFNLTTFARTLAKRLEESDA